MPEAYDRIRSFVAEALCQRERPETPDYLRPSDYWKDFCKYSKYVRSLPEEELRYIRYHSWHLTADNYQLYYFAPDALAANMAEEYAFLRSRLHSDKLFSEGDAGIGCQTPHGKLTIDLLRYMLVMADLFEHGCLPPDRPRTVLEIGGGYGGLACQCMTFNPQLTYVLLDLEETLFYEAVNLQNRFGPERVAFYDFANQRAPDLLPGRFHLIPQSKYQCLQDLRFDLAINQQSMQEMNSRQIENYCDLLQRTTTQFYSSNLQHHSKRIRSEKGIIENLNSYLMRRFRVVWDSDSERSRLGQMFMRMPSGIIATMQLARDYFGLHSPAIAKAYRRFTGAPMRRFSDFRLQRLILSVGEPAKGS